MRFGRLKNFCEVCRKQCKDENGYTCHMNSVAHQKRLRDLATNPEEHIEKYSNDLESKFMQILKNKYPGVAKNVEDLYEEYTQEGYHVKFAYTYWKNLEEFIEHLKKTGRNLKFTGNYPNCTITYLVNKSSEFLSRKRQEQLQQRKERQKQQASSRLEDQMARSRELEEAVYQQMRKQFLEDQQDQPEFVEGQKLELDLPTAKQTYKRSEKFTVDSLQQDYQEDLNYKPKKMKNVEQLFQDLQRKDNERNTIEQPQREGSDDEEWISPGIIVKVLPHDIPQPFHNKKTGILKVKEPYVAQLTIGSACLDVDQTYLETVIPKIGHRVRIVKGQWKGKEGVLTATNLETGTGAIDINSQQVEVPFAHFSKLS